MKPSPPSSPTSTPAPPRSPGAGASPARDGVVLGFTDHDRDLVFDGTTFARRHRLHGQRDQGRRRPRRRQPGGRERAALRQPQRGRPRRRPLRRRGGRDLARQLAATPAQRVLMRSGRIGEVRARRPPSPPRCAASRTTCSSPRAGSSSTRCDADLGDARCTRRSRRSPPSAAPAPSSSPRAGARFTAVRPRRLRRRLVHARPPHLHLRRQRRPLAGGEAAPSPARRRVIELWQPMPAPIAPATPSPSPPAATSTSPPAAPSSPTPSTSAASRTSPATTSSPPSPAPATPPTTAAVSMVS